MRFRSYALAVTLVGLSGTVAAEPSDELVVKAPEPPVFAADWTTIVGLGPLTGTTLLGARYRHIYGRDENPLWNGLYLQTGAAVGTSTFTNSASVHVEAQPIAVFRVRLQAETWRWLGKPSSIGTGLPFTRADAPADPDTLASRSEETIRTHGSRGLLVTTLRGQAGPVALLNMTRISAWYLAQGDGYLYDSESDNLIARGRLDMNLRNRFSVLWMAPRRRGAHRLMLGPVHEFYQSREAALARQRMGAMLVYTPFQRWRALWEPTLILDLGVNRKDRYRQGAMYLLAMLNVPFGRE